MIRLRVIPPPKVSVLIPVSNKESFVSETGNVKLTGTVKNYTPLKAIEFKLEGATIGSGTIPYEKIGKIEEFISSMFELNNGTTRVYIKAINERGMYNQTYIDIDTNKIDDNIFIDSFGNIIFDNYSNYFTWELIDNFFIDFSNNRLTDDYGNLLKW